MAVEFLQLSMLCPPPGWKNKELVSFFSELLLLALQ